MATLRLLLNILGREDLELTGHDLWAEEMIRYAEEFKSETAAWLVAALLGQTRIVVVAGSCVRMCVSI